MGTRDGKNGLVAVQLTVDLKPNLPGLNDNKELMMDLIVEVVLIA